MPWDPMKGERLAPAWNAVRKLLADGRWHPWPEVVSAMLASSDLQRHTCNNLLYAGIKNGHLDRQGKYSQKTKKDNRNVAALPKLSEE